MYFKVFVCSRTPRIFPRIRTRSLLQLVIFFLIFSYCPVYPAYYRIISLSDVIPGREIFLRVCINNQNFRLFLVGSRSNNRDTCLIPLLKWNRRWRSTQLLALRRVRTKDRKWSREKYDWRMISGKEYTLITRYAHPGHINGPFTKRQGNRVRENIRW